MDTKIQQPILEPTDNSSSVLTFKEVYLQLNTLSKHISEVYNSADHLLFKMENPGQVKPPQDNNLVKGIVHNPIATSESIPKVFINQIGEISMRIANIEKRLDKLHSYME